METFEELVDSIVARTAGLPQPETLASWDPPLSGDIDIHILADGTWTHRGDPIVREGLVRLFASLLRREDEKYYLVTPVEKWRIRVDQHPLQAIDCNHRGNNGDGAWYVLLNTGGECRVGGDRVLHGATGGEPPWIDLPNGLSARISRAAWYRLIEEAAVDGDQAYIHSAGERIALGSIR